MMLNTDVNLLESKKLSLEVELNELIKNNAEEDKINELRSEILYIKKQIDKTLGHKEVKKQEEIKRKKSGVDERNIKNYNTFKSRYKRISKMEVATKNILKVIDVYLNQVTYEDNMVKLISR